MTQCLQSLICVLSLQYCDSMVRPLTTISLVMASYGEGYGENSMLMKVATSVLGGGKYLLNAELRAEQVGGRTGGRQPPLLPPCKRSQLKHSLQTNCQIRI